MLTADDLREIARRTDDLTAEKRAYMDRTCEAIKAGWTPYVDMRALGTSEAEGDRAALLSLVRQVAEMDPIWEIEGRERCVVCGEAQRTVQRDEHATDCLWLISQGAKP